MRVPLPSKVVVYFLNIIVGASSFASSSSSGHYHAQETPYDSLHHGSISVEKNILYTNAVESISEPSACISPGREVGSAKLSSDFIESLSSRMERLPLSLQELDSIDSVVPVTFLTKTSKPHIDYYNGGYADPITGLESKPVKGRVGFITLNSNPDAYFSYGNDVHVQIKEGDFIHFDGGSVLHNTVINSGYVKIIGPFEASEFGIVGSLDMPDTGATISFYDVGPQSQFQWTTSYPGTPMFDWNITVTDFMSIDKPTTQQGIYNLRSSYILDDRSFDVKLFKVDCETAPNGIDNFPLVFSGNTVTEDHTTFNKEIDVELEWMYNQTKIESSDLWTANKTGGYSEFCIRVSNYINTTEDNKDFAQVIHFLEVKYKIEVDSLTDFNQTIVIARTEAIEGHPEPIDYGKEEINVFQCTDDYTEILSPLALGQGEFLQICVTTGVDSIFGVGGVKELDVLQENDDTTILYPYVDDFIDSPLTESKCKEDTMNTINAVCKTKMQLVSAYFQLDDPAPLLISGTLKIDYIGRRLSVDLPLTLPRSYSSSNNGDLEEEITGRMLAEEDEGPSFEIEVILSGERGMTQGKSDVSALSTMGALFSAGMTFLGAGMVM